MDSGFFSVLLCTFILTSVICAPTSQTLPKDVSKLEFNKGPQNATAVKTLIGLKFWDHIYTEALKRGSGSNGRELTADNCEVCAVEETAEKVEAAKIEQEERVEAIKATEDAFKFVQKILSVIASPVKGLFNIKSGMDGGAGIVFPNLTKILKLANTGKIHGLPAKIMLGHPYSAELGELGIHACAAEELGNFLSSADIAVIQDFCSKNQLLIKSAP